MLGSPESVSDITTFAPARTLCALARPGGAAFPDGGESDRAAYRAFADGGPRSRRSCPRRDLRAGMARKSAAACRCVATVSMISIRSLARNSRRVSDERFTHVTPSGAEQRFQAAHYRRRG